jgi:hypothetical protein
MAGLVRHRLLGPMALAAEVKQAEGMDTLSTVTAGTSVSPELSLRTPEADIPGPRPLSTVDDPRNNISFHVPRALPLHGLSCSNTL